VITIMTAAATKPGLPPALTDPSSQPSAVGDSSLSHSDHHEAAVSPAPPPRGFDDRWTKGAIARRPLRAVLVDGCDECASFSAAKTPLIPPHDPSSLCRSGKRNHCSCSACF
jgi:hypothetical protein